ncbi:flavoprotein [Streptomyces sp. NPDC056244]|uniref:flavoprotein n=1 Tax=unclassified Streptomyces TaxID=2593676 RepID=UPI0035D7FFC6
MDCYAVAPASANTVAELAPGIADNRALTQVWEAIRHSGTTGRRLSKGERSSCMPPRVAAPYRRAARGRCSKVAAMPEMVKRHSAGTAQTDHRTQRYTPFGPLNAVVRQRRWQR